MIQGKSLVLGAVIGLVLGLFIPINLLELLSQSTQSDYTSVTVVEGHAATVKFGDYEYYFASYLRARELLNGLVFWLWKNSRLSLASAY